MFFKQFGRLRLIVSAFILVSCAVTFWYSPQYAALKLAFRYWDPLAITEYRLKNLSTDDFIKEIKIAINEQDYADAGSLVDIATEYGHQIPEEVVKQAQQGLLQASWRNAKDFYNGAVYGEATNASSISGALAADYVGIGDVRDIAVHGNMLVRGQDYDKLTLGLALFGLATMVPGSGPIDAGASVLKTANKASKISKPLAIKITSIATALVDVPRLKAGLKQFVLPAVKTPSIATMRKSLGNLSWSSMNKMDFSSFQKVASDLMPIDLNVANKAFKGAIRADVTDEIAMLAKSTGSLTYSGGVTGAFRALEHTDTVDDLSRFNKVAKTLKHKTSATIRILGKSAIKLGKLIYALISAVVILVIWSAAVLWFLYSVYRSTRSLFKSREQIDVAKT